MFKAYCSACHGPAGKGDGPAAQALKTRPADLTALARNNRGAFPAAEVERVLRFGTPLPAHGSSDMPVWGEAFLLLGDEAMARYRIAALAAHVATLQAR